MLVRSLAAAALVAAISSPCYALHAPSSNAMPRSALGVQDSRPAGSLLKSASVLNARAMSLRGGAGKAVASKPAETAPWYSAFWNESVELGVLFGLWYFGNVQCEKLECVSVPTTFVVVFP